MLSWTFSKYIGCQKTDTVTLMGFLSHVTDSHYHRNNKKPQKEPQIEENALKIHPLYLLFDMTYHFYWHHLTPLEDFIVPTS